MYNYDFKENNETTILEKENSIIEIDGNDYNLSVLITNKNILFFKNVNVGNVLNTRGMYMPPEYLLEFKIPKDQIKLKIENNNSIIKYLDSEIVIYNLDLKDFM